MSINKSAIFDRADQQLAAFAKALAHPARVAILRVLAEHGTCICGQVVEVLPLAQSTVSQHLKELKEAGLIQGEVDGPRMCYCIDQENLAVLSAQLSLYLSALAQQKSTCC